VISFLFIIPYTSSLTLPHHANRKKANSSGKAKSFKNTVASSGKRKTSFQISRIVKVFHIINLLLGAEED